MPFLLFYSNSNKSMSYYKSIIYPIVSIWNELVYFLNIVK